MSKPLSRRKDAPALLPLAASLAIALGGACVQVNAGAFLDRYDAEHAQRLRHNLVAHARVRGNSPGHAPSPPHAANTRTVTTCNDAGSGSLRAVVAAARSGDTIDLGKLRCATITLTGGAIETALDDLTITSRGRDVTIDGNLADRILSHGGAGTLALTGVTLTRGRATAAGGFVFGGCVYSSGSLALDHARLVECDASSPTESAYGGGAFAYGAVSLVSSTVANNTLHAAMHAVGGGVLAASGMRVRNSTISGNATFATRTADVPPGYSIDASMGGLGSIYDLDIADSVIEDNHVTATSDSVDNVAIANEAGVMAFYTLTMARSTISGNSGRATNTASSATGYAIAYSVGGGARANAFEVSDSTISGNSTSVTAANPEGVAYAAASGGGVRTFGRGPLAFTNSTISGNSSTRSVSAAYGYGYAGGGGVFSNGTSITLKNSTIAFNTAEFGGGVYQYLGADLSAQSTIVANNSGGGGGFSGNAGADFGTLTASTVAGSANLIVSANANALVPPDTLASDPLLAPLAANGGPTRTHALRRGSPAIDAGYNGVPLKFDQRGNGYPRMSGAAVDIGAFEAKQ